MARTEGSRACAARSAESFVCSCALATAIEPKPRLHPGLAEVYRQKLAELHAVQAAEDGHEVREAIRALVEAIVRCLRTGCCGSRCGMIWR